MSVYVVTIVDYESPEDSNTLGVFRTVESVVECLKKTYKDYAEKELPENDTTALTEKIRRFGSIQLWVDTENGGYDIRVDKFVVE
jgi:hypothetical protein